MFSRLIKPKILCFSLARKKARRIYPLSQVLACKDLSDFYDFFIDGVGLMASELIDFLKSSGLSIDEGEATERGMIEIILAKQDLTLPEGVSIDDIEKVSWT